MTKLDKSKNKQQLTSIAVSKENYQRLRQLGYATQSMNDVLNNVLDYVYKVKENDED